MIDPDRERPCEAPALPSSLAALVAGYRWSRDMVGESGGAVFRLWGKAGAPDLYLKYGRGAVAGDVMAEALRLPWLAAHVAVPAVVHFTTVADEAWLLAEALDGRTAWQWLDGADPGSGEAEAVADALAGFLRGLHAMPVVAAPFDARHPVRLAAARERIDAGLVDADDFDEERQGRAPEALWADMLALLPMPDDPVMTHGDFSLDNLLLRDGVVTGCIDVGRAGIADRYQDLAIMWNCLGEFCEPLQRRFLSSYGIDVPDERRLRFHLLLDEFF